MKKILYILGILSLALFFSTSVEASGDMTPNCPIGEQAGRIIVHLGDNQPRGDVLIRADQGEANAKLGPLGAALPAGTYNVILSSWDDHHNKPNQTQNNEEWYLILEDNGSEVTSTLPIADLPDDQDFLTQFVQMGLVVGSDIDSVTAFHFSYQNGVNSIVPLCAGFDPVEEENHEPSITIHGDNPLEISRCEAFTEPGFSASDEEDGDLTGDVVVSGSVDDDTPGSYDLTYYVEDSTGAFAQETRTVIVTDADCGGGEGDDTVKNENSAKVINIVSSGANTGGNSAGGSEGGNGGDGGDIKNAEDVDDLSTGNGGDGGNGGSGGLIDTGDATSVSTVINEINSNDTRIDRCACSGDDDGDVVVRNRNRAKVITLASSDSDTGDNSAGGGEGGDGGDGGDITNNSEDVDDSSTGNGGDGGDGGSGGLILTGPAFADTAVINVINRNITRIRR